MPQEPPVSVAITPSGTISPCPWTAPARLGAAQEPVVHTPIDGSANSVALPVHTLLPEQS